MKECDKKPELKLIGKQNISEEMADGWTKSWKRAIKEAEDYVDKSYPLADLSPQELTQHQELEAKIDDYFYKKIRSYGVDNSDIELLPSAIYALLPEDRKT